jgi:hypothetical protein
LANANEFEKKSEEAGGNVSRGQNIDDSASNDALRRFSEHGMRMLDASIGSNFVPFVRILDFRIYVECVCFLCQMGILQLRCAWVMMRQMDHFERRFLFSTRESDIELESFSSLDSLESIRYSRCLFSGEVAGTEGIAD